MKQINARLISWASVIEEITLQQAAEAADAYAEAVRATARFVQGLDDLPEADALAEYAHLLGQEESLREARTAALTEAGLTVPSLEPDPE